MLTRKIVRMVLGIFLLIETIYLSSLIIERGKMDDFNCVANLVQHYSDKSYAVSLNYTVIGKFGLVHITGFTDEQPKNTFNRKISFELNRDGDIFYMKSHKNIKLPDDDFDDTDLRKYIPQFFIAPGKDIYMRILRQENRNYVFMVDSIPTYVCNSIT